METTGDPMSQRFKCKRCKGNYKSLTKEDLCAFCYQKTYGKWPREYQENNQKKGKRK